MVELTGEVTRTFKEDVDFSAGALFERATGRTHRFAGRCFVKVGDNVTLDGDWFDDPKFGRQFKVDGYKYVTELDEHGLASFLEKSDAFRGIGRSRARKIAQRYGAKFEEALEDPARMAEECGIPIEVAENLAKEWILRRDANVAMADLARYGITPGRAKALVEQHGNEVVGIVRANPYWLIGRVFGFGFKRVDEIARAVGIPKDHPERLRHAVLHTLETFEDDGNTWTDAKEVYTTASGLLELDGPDDWRKVVARINEMANEGAEILAVERPQPDATPDAEKRFALYLRATYDDERLVWDRLYDAARNPARDLGWTPEAVREFEPSLNDEQVAAVVLALKSRVSVITGGAGVGKTFTMRTIARAAVQSGLTVGLCAPTGKAAKRVAQVVDMTAQTMHRYLQGTPQEVDGKLVFQFSGQVVDQFVMIDEASMCDVHILARFLERVDPELTQVVLVGDHHQLPSVGPGAILRDAIASKSVPVALLEKVVRQAGVLKRNTSAILDGVVVRDPPPARPAPGERRVIDPWYVLGAYKDAHELRRAIESLFASRLEAYDIEMHGERRPIDPVEDVQLLTPQHKGPVGTVALNAALQRIFQRKRGVEPPPRDESDPRKAMVEARPMLGDKIVWTKNDYELGVMNGTMGRVIGEDKKEGTLTILFDDNEVPVDVEKEKTKLAKLAYAMTVHKSQGSEFPVVVAVCHMSHKFMQHRGLIYTAVSRSRASCMIVGDAWGITYAAKTVKSNLRRTLPTLGSRQ